MASPPLFERATVTRVIRETADARTFVLSPEGAPFEYQAGQFCIFRVNVEGRDLLRSYSMSSAPETDAELSTTVKRVPGGRVSGWMVDRLTEGDVIEMTRPRGRFCLRPAEGPMLGFAGGSGITPIISLAKSVLATTDRSVRLLCADRDEASAIFVSTLAELAERHPGRLSVVRHLDSEQGLITPEEIRDFVGEDVAADSYLCGPEPFMDLVESVLPGPGSVFTERFGAGPVPPQPPAKREIDGKVTIVLGAKRVSVPMHADETLLQTARRAALTPPFSCEQGNCATCMARLTEGAAKMRVNDALTEDEVAEGWVLTCQAVPTSPSVTVVYE